MSLTNVVLGVSAGIAAYKVAELVRLLKKNDHQVIPVLTESAHHFVSSMTLAALAGNKVRSSLWDEEAEMAMGHIELARWADLVVVAPATADVLAKMSSGIATDLLTTVYLATSAPTLLAPSMNQGMWTHPATQRNVQRLRADGARLVGPNSGDQACGDIGPGRMAEPQEIMEALSLLEHELSGSTSAVGSSRLPLQGTRVVVTAGPTREAIDPVRYISNASSGRQGFAMAKAVREAGADVVLISGPVSQDTPLGVERIDVLTAAEMKDAVMKAVSNCDILIAVAAVADYRPKLTADRKIKKRHDSSNDLSLELIENDDIIHSVAMLPSRPYLVGFAAETHNVEQYAREKRARKDLDAIVLNDVSNTEIGFDSTDNAVTLIFDEHEMRIERADKLSIARKVVREVVVHYLAKSGARDIELNGE